MNDSLSNINVNAEVIPLNNFTIQHTPEYKKNIPKTPNRPTQSIFGKLGQMPGNGPIKPNPIRTMTRWKGKVNKTYKATKSIRVNKSRKSRHQIN